MMRYTNKTYLGISKKTEIVLNELTWLNKYRADLFIL